MLNSFNRTADVIAKESHNAETFSSNEGLRSLPVTPRISASNERLAAVSSNGVLALPLSGPSNRILISVHLESSLEVTGMSLLTNSGRLSESGELGRTFLARNHRLRQKTMRRKSSRKSSLRDCTMTCQHPRPRLDYRSQPQFSRRPSRTIFSRARSTS